MIGHRRRRKKLGYRKAESACGESSQFLSCGPCPVAQIHDSSRTLKPCSITDPDRNTIGNCQRSKSRCQPGTGSSCFRCDRVGKICDLEAKETSQDMPATRVDPPNGESGQGITKVWGSGTSVPSMASQGQLARQESSQNGLDGLICR